jgi:cobalamin biosynthesis protein CobT
LIFFNPAYSSLSERVLKLKQDMINPFVAFRDWLQEEILDVEAMKEALKQIRNLLETESKLKDKLNTLEEDLKKGQQGQVNIFKSIFKKKEDIIAEMEKEKEITQQKIADIGEIIKIVGDNMENQIEIFKNDKTQNYYKYLKMFAILQRESNRVIRELWTLVKNGLNDINPNMASDDNYQPQPEQYENNEQNEIHEDYEKQEPQEQQEQQDQNEIHEEKIENQEQNEEQPPQEGEEGGNTEE